MSPRKPRKKKARKPTRRKSSSGPPAKRQPRKTSGGTSGGSGGERWLAWRLRHLLSLIQFFRGAKPPTGARRYESLEDLIAKATPQDLTKLLEQALSEDDAPPSPPQNP